MAKVDLDKYLALIDSLDLESDEPEFEKIIKILSWVKPISLELSAARKVIEAARQDHNFMKTLIEYDKVIDT